MIDLMIDFMIELMMQLVSSGTVVKSRSRTRPDSRIGKVRTIRMRFGGDRESLLAVGACVRW
jgi:hypothetical protein